MAYINNIKNNFNAFQNNYLPTVDGLSDVKKIFEKAFQAISNVGIYFKSKITLSETQISNTRVIESKESSKTRKYLEYPRTPEHEKALRTVMENMSLGGYFKIARRAQSLYAAGDKLNFKETKGQIHGVQPLRQLGYICRKKDLKGMLKIIMNYSGRLAVVKTRYLQKMAIVLDIAQKNNQIVPMLKDFVDEIAKEEKISNSEKNKLIKKLTEIAKRDDKDKWEVFITALF